MASKRGGARELVLRYVADARDFISGTDKASDAAGDLARETDKLTAAERRQAREADAVRRAVDKLDKSYDKAKRGADDFADETGKGLKGKLGGVGGEVGDEFTENFGEAMRGGDPFGALIETATSLGPALGAAGVAAAAAFGIGKALYDDAQRFKKAAKQVGADMVDALRDGMLDATEREGLLTAALGVDSLPDALKKAEQLARRLGVPAQQVLTYLMTAGQQAGPELSRALGASKLEIDKLRGSSSNWYEQVSNTALAADDIQRYAGAAAQGLSDANRWATDLNGSLAAAKGNAGSVASSASTIAAKAAAAKRDWAEFERAMVRGGTAPGIVRAEATERRRRP